MHFHFYFADCKHSSKQHELELATRFVSEGGAVHIKWFVFEVARNLYYSASEVFGTLEQFGVGLLAHSTRSGEPHEGLSFHALDLTFVGPSCV